MLMSCGDVAVRAAGMMVTPTTPATGAGDGLLIALAVVNVFLLVSPIIIGLVLGLQVRFNSNFEWETFMMDFD